MLTVKQKATFKDLKQGKLTAKQKADFYYRISKIFEAEAKFTIKEMSMLLDEIPDTYLEKKIDFYAMANDSMELLEKLLINLEPAPVFGDGEEKKVIRRFRVEVDNPIPDVILNGDYKPIAVITATYRPNESETEFIERLKNFVDHARGSMDLAAKDFRNYTMDEFNKKLKKLKKKQDLKVSMAPMTGE